MALVEHHSGRRRRRSPKPAPNVAGLVALVVFLGFSAFGLVHFARALAELPSVVWHQPWGGIKRYEPAPIYRAADSAYPYSVVLQPAAMEPPEVDFDTAMAPIVTPPEIQEPTKGAHFWPPAIPPPAWCCGLEEFPGYGIQTAPPRPPGVSEPTTAMLLGTGVFVMLIRVARRPHR